MTEFPDQKVINSLVADLTKDRAPKASMNGAVRPPAADLPDVNTVIENVRKDPERREIFDGGIGHYDSLSEADGRMFHNLAYFCRGDLVLMEEAALRSGRNRPKWHERRKGTTWLRWELEKAAGRIEDEWEGRGSNHGDTGRNAAAVDPPRAEQNPLLASLVDLAGMIENGVEDPEELEPGILLKGKVHHIFAPAAVGKTYLALWFAARQIKQGRRVLYLDAENGARIFTERLGQMGVSTEAIRDHLFYLPFPTLEMSAAAGANYIALIESIDPTLVIFDSWIKFLSSAGLAEDSNDDVARWSASFLQPIRNAGITSVVLDHVPHDGNRSRGASRKRDEVDVQYALIKTQKFDRVTVGEIRLKLEKDREGWLPEFTTFAIGGTKDRGFIFQRGGTTTDGPGQIILKSKEKEAFEILAGEFGEAGARHNEWRKACLDKRISKTSFGRARDELIRIQMVRREEDAVGPLYLPILDPTGSTGDGPDFSRYVTVIPDRVQEGPNRVHGPDGTQEGPQGPHPLRGGSVDPAHEPGSKVDEENDWGEV